MQPQVSSLKTQTKAEAAYSALRRLIIEGTLPPGSTIDQEQIAQLLGVSTTPLREALRRLEGERLLVGAAHTQVAVSGLSMEDLNAIYEVRLELDPLAARLAAERATEAERQQMLEFVSHGDLESDPFVELEKNHILHRTVYEACHNPVLIDMLDALWDRSDRFRYVLLKNTPGMQSPTFGRDLEHDRTLKAVIEKRPREAEHIMRDHLLTTLDTLRDYLPFPEKIADPRPA